MRALRGAEAGRAALATAALNEQYEGQLRAQAERGGSGALGGGAALPRSAHAARPLLPSG